MNKHLWLSSACGLLIAAAGAMAPLASVQAYDNVRKADDASKSQAAPKSGAALDKRYGGSSSAKGAEGPIRTDMGADKAGGAMRDDVARDMKEGRYPMKDGVGIP